MESVFTKIQELQEIPTFSKHEQLVNGIINAIDDKLIIQGSMLPSVNSMVSELGFARKTIVKAYTDLKERGIVESKNRKGYFVTNNSTQQTVKVALILYAFHSFQEKFYNNFRKALGENIQLDIFFHHNNIEVFETIITSIAAQYGMYVVAPIKHKRTKELLLNIPSNKLLMVDRYLNIGKEYSYASQRFKKPMYEALQSLESTLQNFKHFVLFFKEKTDYPKGILRGFEEFMQERGWDGKIESSYENGMLKKGTVYFTINDNDLWEIIKESKQTGMVLGKDIGILSHNESTIKEIISGGITTFSTDFKLMAQRAADFVLTRTPIQETVPSVLVRRASL